MTNPQDLKVSGIRYTVVSYAEYTDIDFEPPATFYVRSAMGDYYFFHTRDRAKAQAACDEMFGAGRYTVHSSKIQRGKGTLTCTGTQTKRGQRR